MRKQLDQIRRFVENPDVKLAVGLILLVSSGQEVITDVEEGLQAAHGIFFFAIFHILKILPEMTDGHEHVSAAGDEEREP